MKQGSLPIPISLLGHYLEILTNWWIIRHGIPPESASDPTWVEFIREELKNNGEVDDLDFLYLICLALRKQPLMDLTVYDQSDGYWTNEDMYLVIQTIESLSNVSKAGNLNVLVDRVEFSQTPLKEWREKIRPTLKSEIY